MEDPTPRGATRSISKKICLLGDFAVGKTSLIRRFVYDRFDDRYISTIGVKVSRKTLMVADGSGVVELNLLLWDLAGSDAFREVRASYLRGAAGAILVCDLSRPETVACLPDFTAGLRSASADPALIMAANKRDLLAEPTMAPGAAAEMAARLEIPLHLTSARHGDEVEALFRQLGQLLVHSTASPKAG
jgi:small GTP-binding protein